MKNNKLPLVSIIVPTYNTEKYLTDCLNSLITQTYKNIEIIIVNDGSTDKSKQIISRFIKKHSNIKVIENSKPSGSGEVASNTGIKNAKGKYIAIMDSDDISMPERISVQVDYLENNSDVFLVSSSAFVINEDNEVIKEFNVGMSSDLIFKKLYLNNSIINSSVMFRLSEIAGNFYQIKYPFYNDYYSWFYYLSKHKKFFTLNNKLVKYRINLKSSTRSNLKRNFLISYAIKNDFLTTNIFKISACDRIVVQIQNMIIWLIPEDVLIFLSKCNQKITSK